METDVIPQVQGWIQIGTAAGFGGLVWYLLAVQLPKLQQRFDDHSRNTLLEFRQEQKELRESHQHTIKAIIEQYERHLDRLTKAFTRDK